MVAVIDEDAALVARSVAGCRPAFEQIVTRYQPLVCSVAYSAIGNLHRSEDVAQETFVTAWRQLPSLREPARLRAWLCGIARNVAVNVYQRESREAGSSLSLDEFSQVPADGDADVLEGAIRDEEQALLWRAIAAMPALYREPMVLFYREQGSIEDIAAALELSSDVVRQRLSRGRKWLHADIVALVERTLARGKPGEAFTLAVMAALPALGMAPATSAAAVGLGAVPGTLAAKSGIATAIVALVGPAAGVVSAGLSLRAALDAAPTTRERRLVVRQSVELVGGAVLFAVALCVLVFLGPRLGAHAGLLLTLAIILSAGFTAWLLPTLLRGLSAMSGLRVELGGPSNYRELRSATTWLGWPLYHVRFGTPPPGAGFVRGWIALGDRSVGLIFAMGQIAVAPISLGVVAVGGVSVGAFAVGVVPMASVALGALPLGGATFGLLAIGGFAAGAFGAVGGLALSLGYAGGRFALAPHANDAAATAWLSTWLPPWLVPGLVVFMVVLAIVPPLVFAVLQRRLAPSVSPQRKAR